MFYIVTESAKIGESYSRTLGRYIFEERKEAEEFVDARRAKRRPEDADIRYSIISGEEDE